MNKTPHLAFYKLSHSFNKKPTFDNLSLEIPKGETLFLVGESGSGKTTLLKTLCQLLSPKTGEILLSGQNINTISHQEYKKKFGYVIQKAGLLPHLTIRNNIQLPAKIHNLNDKLELRSETICSSLNLDYHEIKNRYPHQLSGGQRQRVGIARALINDPEILFMDEPFGALDPLTKKGIYKDFLSLQNLTHKTIIIVSHDMHEAAILSDRIAILKEGHFEQIGTYSELKSNPKTDYVKEYMSEWSLN